MYTIEKRWKVIINPGHLDPLIQEFLIKNIPLLDPSIQAENLKVYNSHYGDYDNSVYGDDASYSIRYGNAQGYVCTQYTQSAEGPYGSFTNVQYVYESIGITAGYLKIHCTPSSIDLIIKGPVEAVDTIYHQFYKNLVPVKKKKK